ncbi:polyketide synthase [Fusarium heterosporum]|uniref:Polyketide synthase n=1 Tax=Fusarium heterosporum TaxID=42747 RepID=A0A8H5SZP8_FUSHE|nr:polyketide synthase [Fusarium heterosporum]
MSIVEPIIRDHQVFSQDDNSDSILHVEWQNDVNFFNGAELRPRTPLCKATADRQITLARAAALIIRTSLNNIPLDIPDFDPCKLNGFPSKLVLGDVTMSVTIEIFSSLSQLGVEGEILAKIGPNMAGILQGTVDPMSLLLENDRFGRMLDGMELMQKTRAHLKRYMSLYATKRPSLNVLEVGASTNRNAAALGYLSGRRSVSYTVTNASVQALEQVGSWAPSNSKLKVFNINQNPLEQGFSPESFDVVLVNNILHMANSLEKSLADLRKLLVPGGALILVGFSDLSPAYNLIFGMNENMWSDKRCEQLPYPASNEWTRMLQNNGFSGLEPATTTFDFIGQESYCVISTAVASTQRLMVNILPDTQGKLFGFADQLSSSLADANTASTISPILDEVSSRFIYVVLDNGSSPLSVYEKLAKADDVFWISMKTDNIEPRDMHTVTRFAQNAHRDHPGHKVVTLDVKQDRLDYSDILKVVTRIIQVSFQEDRGTRTEVEYEYRNGRVFVPRVTSSGMKHKLG